MMPAVTIHISDICISSVHRFVALKRNFGQVPSGGCSGNQRCHLLLNRRLSQSSLLTSYGMVPVVWYDVKVSQGQSLDH